MSLKPLKWALDIRGVPSGKQLVLLRLANNSNEDGFCYPSEEYIADKAGLGLSTVRGHLRWLEMADVIERKRMVKGKYDGRRNGFQMNFDVTNVSPETTARIEQTLKKKLPPESGKLPPESSTDTARNEHEYRQNPAPYIETLLEPPMKRLEETPPNPQDADKPSTATPKAKPKARARSVEELKSCPMFNAFWVEYPKGKKKAKPVAAKAFDKEVKQNELVFDEVMDGLKRYKRTDDWQKERGKYIPLPATFINQRRWEDEIDTGPNQPPPPTPGFQSRLELLEQL